MTSIIESITSDSHLILVEYSDEKMNAKIAVEEQELGKDFILYIKEGAFNIPTGVSAINHYQE